MAEDCVKESLGRKEMIEQHECADVSSELARNRIVNYCVECIDIANAGYLIEQLLSLEAKSHKPIFLVINTFGGDTMASMSIYDCIKGMQSPVYAVCMGVCASSGTLIISAYDGVYSFPNTSFLVHPMSLGYDAAIHSFVKYAQFSQQLYDRYIQVIYEKTGKDMSYLEVDKWLSAKEAKEFGLVDNIVSKFLDVTVSCKRKE